MRGQPRGREGTPERPYSPLTLRLVLAAFGLVVSVAFAVLMFSARHVLLAALLAVLALVAAVDLVVVQLRRRAAQRRP